MSLPLISCVMPTANRRKFIPKAIELFKRYDYPHKQLVILDDGEDCVKDLVPNDPRFLYEYSHEKKSIGLKRNQLLKMAAGDYIAHHDDDDWYCSDRLTLMMGILLGNQKLFTGIRDGLFWDLRNQEGHRYNYGINSTKTAVGSTMVYHRSVWQHNPFLNKETGEDTTFNYGIPDNTCLVLPKMDTMFVAIHHSDVTSQTRDFSKEQWESVPVEKIYSIVGADRNYYQTLNR